MTDLRLDDLDRDAPSPRPSTTSTAARARPRARPAPGARIARGQAAAWIRRLARQPPVTSAFDEPVSRARTTRIVDRTHFVVRTTSRRGPRFTG